MQRIVFLDCAGIAPRIQLRRRACDRRRTKATGLQAATGTVPTLDRPRSPI
ncbi:MAG TPA: hypothetical protein VLW08_01070 [Casimicrobiaceae bacterium]|nr:hypothetical protein [Casimicrobiaceae bacterium]